MTDRSIEALLLDEMIGPGIADALRDEGFDVLAVAGHPVLAAAPDAEIARWAAHEDRRVLTENVRDSAPLTATTEPRCACCSRARGGSRVPGAIRDRCWPHCAPG